MIKPLWIHDIDKKQFSISGINGLLIIGAFSRGDAKLFDREAAISIRDHLIKIVDDMPHEAEK